MPRHPDAVAENRTAGKWAAWVHSDHAYSLLAVTDHLDQRVGQGALAGAGRAGEPNEVGTAGVGLDFCHQLGRLRVTIFRQADGPRQRPDIAGQ